MTRTLIETVTNEQGGKYELYQTGKSFLSVVYYVERINSKANISAETVTRRHRNYDAALNSHLRKTFD